MSLKHRFVRAQEGFTLVVIAGLFAAFAVIATAAIDRNSIARSIDQQANTKAQLSRLSTAILKYYAANSNKYPCPARYDVLTTSTSPLFGDEWTGCQTGTQTGIDVLKLTDNSTDSNVIRGMVPVNALVPYGADPADAIDPWGDKIMYVVHRQMTPSGSGTATNCSATAGCAPGSCSCTTATNRPFLTDGVTSTAINSPDFILVSYGPDRLGGIMRSNSSAAVNCGAASNVLRNENCDSDILFLYRPNYLGNATSATRYDDILSFYLAAPVTLSGSGGSYDTDATAYFAAMSVQPDSTRKNLINDLIVGLKADGLWTKIGWISLLASHDSQSSRLNMKNPSQSFTVVGSPTFTTDRGWAGDNTTGSYLDSGAMIDNGGIASLNSGFLSIWVNNAPGSGNTWPVSGGVQGGTGGYFYVPAQANTYYPTVNDYSNSPNVAIPGSSYLGMHTVSRTSSSVKTAYKNSTSAGSSSGDNTNSLANVAVRAVSMQSCTSSSRYPMIAWGSGLTGTEVGNLYTRMNTYLTAIGAN